MKLIDIDSLNPSTYNPRTADPRRLDLIELSLRKLGFLLPIYATPDGEIISGHQRHHVAKRLGVRQVPVEFTRAMDLEERKGVNVAFNRATNDLRPKDIQHRRWYYASAQQKKRGAWKIRGANEGKHHPPTPCPSCYSCGAYGIGVCAGIDRS